MSEPTSTQTPNEAIGPLVPILAGGGTRLPAHVGIIHALNELGADPVHIVGVSGGSIVAALWANGWSVDSMRRLATDVDFTQFRGFSLPSLLFQGGFCNGDHFENWMIEQLNGARFRDLKRPLSVVASDVATGTPVVFSQQETPDFSVGTAVRYSMGIPLLFTYKKYGEHLMVDGSILSEDALHRDWAGDGTPVSVFRLRATRMRPPKSLNPRFPLPGYVSMLIRSFMTTLSREYISDTFWTTTVVVDTVDVSPLEFSLSPEKKGWLFDEGYRTTLEILPRKMGRWPNDPQPNSA